MNFEEIPVRKTDAVNRHLNFSSLTFITASRYGGSLETIFKLIVDRLLFVNYEVNVARVVTYVENNDLQYGLSLVRDVRSVVTDTRSTQEYLTYIFNPDSSISFVMSLPAFAESKLNFPIFLPRFTHSLSS